LSKNLLIIEDDKLVANIYRNKLAVEGFDVTLAHDGEKGLELARQTKPDIILLDLLLPKLTGVEVLRALRASPETQAIPVVVLSNTYLTSMVQEAWKAGAIKCLAKVNCTPKQVIDVLNNVLKPAAPAAAQPAAPPVGQTGQPPATPLEAEEPEFDETLRREFVQNLPRTLGTLRASLQNLARAGGEGTRLVQLQEFHRSIRSLSKGAGLVGLLRIALVADALEVLLDELCKRPADLTSSVLRTLALAVDFLGYLFEHNVSGPQPGVPSASILVVDDDPLWRRAITHSLARVRLKAVCVPDATTALTLLAENDFDLVLLDVVMPDMDGFELCSRLRKLPAHAHTPVVFITSTDDLQSRTSSMMSGATDFIVKPFLFVELAVKALIYVLRGKPAATSPAPASPPSDSSDANRLATAFDKPAGPR